MPNDALKSTVRIVNKTGIARDTKVYGPGGKQIKGIFKIVIHPFESTDMVRVDLSVYTKNIDITAAAVTNPPEEKTNGTD